MHQRHCLFCICHTALEGSTFDVCNTFYAPTHPIRTTHYIWILVYRVGDQMPDKAAIHLPSMLTVKAVYEKVKQDLEMDQHIVISLPHFYYLWNEFYSHVSIPTVSNLALLSSGCLQESSLFILVHFLLLYRKTALQSVIHVVS